MHCRLCGQLNKANMQRCAACGAPLQMEDKPYNYLAPAIICTLFCCVPLGIVSIVFAAQVDSKWNSGDFAGALNAAQKAKLFFWLSFGFGLVVGTLYLMLVIIGAASDEFARFDSLFPRAG